MNSKHVLIIGGRDHTLHKLEKMGVRYSMMQFPDLVTDHQIKHSSRYAVMNCWDTEEALLVAQAWHAVDPFDAVLSFAEGGLLAASYCAANMQLPGNNLEAVKLTQDKIQMRRLMEQHGLSPVRFQTCETREQALVFFRSLDRQPIVLKPFRGSGSEGVFYADSEAVLAERWDAHYAGHETKILAEEFLDGPEFSIESISINGKHEIAMITEKITTALPIFIEVGHQVPARLHANDTNAIKQLVTDFLNAVQQKTGPAHTEIRLTSNGPRIIESQTRIGGDQIWEMCELVTGIDQMSETICELLDLPPPRRQSLTNAAAIRFFSFAQTRIVAIENLAQAESAPGVVRVKCTLQPGQILGELYDSDSRQGYVLCTGETVEAAVLNAETAQAMVNVRTAPIVI